MQIVHDLIYLYYGNNLNSTLLFSAQQAFV